MWSRRAGPRGKPCLRACEKMTAVRRGGREAANWYRPLKPVIRSFNLIQEASKTGSDTIQVMLEDSGSRC